MKEVDWHHAPLHRFVPGAVHMITAGTYQKQLFFRGDERLQLMQDLLLEHFHSKGWRVHAWACFPNHYHLIALAPGDGDLTFLLKEIHSKLALKLNRMDAVKGRKVMYQFWDSCISYDNSYYDRLNYVMHNPVKHGIVSDAEHYRFCSARWFREKNPSVFRRKVKSYPFDTLNVPDDFD